MVKKLNRHYKMVILCLISIAVSAMLISACYLGKKRYYEYEVTWYCDQPYIEFVANRHDGGKMVIDGKSYNTNMAWGNNGTSIIVFDADKDDYIIWEADTKIKDGKLIFSITVDNVSDYIGQTITLNQRLIEEVE